MGTKADPGPYDCYAAAEPDEPMFVLLARDPLAPEVVRLWATFRAAQAVKDAGGKIGRKTPDPDEVQKVSEAHLTANAMERWRKANR